MPTYEYRCPTCGEHHEKVQSIGQYSICPDVPVCCGAPAERYLSVVPVSAGANVLHGDRHYEGLRAPDGTDIGSRTKHREYMSRTGLTLSDDFKGQWKKEQEARKERLTGTYTDKDLRTTLERETYRRIK
jgi:putative FmdB family regulatory protein